MRTIFVLWCAGFFSLAATAGPKGDPIELTFHKKDGKQEKQIWGVGVPGVPVDYRWNPSMSHRWPGWCCELEHMTRTAMRRACRDGYWGTAITHSCIETQSELEYWVERGPNKHGPFYAKYWHSLNTGGSPEKPMWIDQSNFRAARSQVDILKAQKRWKVGLTSYKGAFGDVTAPRKPPAEWNGWVVWVDVRLSCDDDASLEGCDQDPVPPPPPPVPPVTKPPVLSQQWECLLAPGTRAVMSRHNTRRWGQIWKVKITGKCYVPAPPPDDPCGISEGRDCVRAGG